MTFNGGTEPIAVQGAYVSPNLFGMFGRQPLVGRAFSAEEDPAGARVLVLGEGLANARFGSPRDAIGQGVLLGRDRWQVIGVMPADFRVPFLDTQAWAPVRSHPEWNSTEESNPLERPRWCADRSRRGRADTE